MASITVGALKPVRVVTTTLWNNTTTPATLSDNDTASVELGLKFRASTAGHITGVKFYKSTANAGRREPLARIKAIYNVHIKGEPTILGTPISM